jgi:hypothetical protein
MLAIRLGPFVSIPRTTVCGSVCLVALLVLVRLALYHSTLSFGTLLCRCVWLLSTELIVVYSCFRLYVTLSLPCIWSYARMALHCQPLLFGSYVSAAKNSFAAWFGMLRKHCGRCAWIRYLNFQVRELVECLLQVALVWAKGRHHQLVLATLHQ